MGKNYDFDYIIIGSGAAGRTAAGILARAKKNVAIIEGSDFGGAEINTRDIPYTVNLDFSHNYYRLLNMPAVGGQEISFNFPTLASHQNYLVATLRAQAVQDVKDAGAKIIYGYAHFLDAHTVAVNQAQYTAENFILATGAQLKTSEISGIDTINYLTPDTALKMRRLPKFVFVIGGGPTGCEIAEYFAELGTKVLIMERTSRLLPREDKEVSEAITEYFTKELGMMVITNSKVVALEQDEISKRVVFSAGANEKMVRVDSIVLATGSEPALDYGLENAGVKYRRTGVLVDRNFTTSAKNIFAVGDVCGHDGDSSTKRSRYEATILAKNLFKKRGKILPNYAGFSRFINTNPEIVAVGMNERDLTARDLKFRRGIVYLSELKTASLISENATGFVKILAGMNGTIYGASIVAPGASLFANELELAVRQKISVAAIAEMPHTANQFYEALQRAAQKLVRG